MSEKTYERSDELELLARDVIASDERLANLALANIGYLQADFVKTASGGRIVNGDCEKVGPKWRALTGYDFVITFYKTAELLNEHQRRLLMFHELRHAGFDPGSGDRWTIPHDVEDFADIIQSEGVDWAVPEGMT